MPTTPAISKRVLFLTGILKKMNFDPNDIKTVRKAYEFALKKHGDQLRKSGEPYIIHPIETAIYLAEWKMDIPTVVTGLLHDVLEDTDCTEQEMEEKFGKEVVEMVKAVTKVSKVSNENRIKETYDDANSEYVVRVIMSISNDLRPIMVKLADRLHNMTTISHLRRDKQVRIASETFNIYANIAGRLGLYQQKTTLLDLSFSVLEPEAYNRTRKILDNILNISRTNLNQMSAEIQGILKKNNIECQVIERIKGVYSTYKKISKGIEPKDIHDIFAVRIIGDYSEIKCYEILGLIHLNFTCKPNTFKDYISSPKLNLYQSLHTTIVYKKSLLEVQIRNTNMDNIANYGMAAHWIYKANDSDEDKKITFELMRDVFEIDELESLKRIKNIQQRKIYDVLLLNNNKWYVVAENSTVLDLAYRYDPNKIMYLKNVFKEGVAVPLYYVPIKDDILTLEYSDTLTAKKSWTAYTTNDELKQQFEKLEELNIVENKEALAINRVNQKLNDNLADTKELKKRLSYLNFNSLNEYLEFFESIQFNNDPVIYGFLSNNKKWKKYYTQLIELKEKSNLFSYNIKNIPGFDYKKVKFPDCCSKIPGMQIVGLVDKNILYVHSFYCEKIEKNKKLYILEWDEKRIAEFPKMYYCELSIDYNTAITKVIALINFITSKGIEITYLLTTKVNHQLKNTKFRMKVNHFNVIKKLIDDMYYKFEGISLKVK